MSAGEDLKRAEKRFLQKMQKTGIAKVKVKQGRPGKPTAEAIIQQALRDNTTTFFNRVLNDEMEERLWMHFLEGRVTEVNKDGDPKLDKDGNLVYREISGVSWNAFKQMVAYKRGMPAIKVDSNPDSGRVTVNFNVMGVPAGQMEKRVRELEQLPVSGS